MVLVEEKEDVLTLCVGGTDEIHLCRHILTLFSDSMLAVQFSGRWNEERDEKDRICIHQPANLFLPLVDYLRAVAAQGGDVSKVTAPTPRIFQGDSGMFSQFIQIVDYYGLVDYMYPVRIVPLPKKTATKQPILYVGSGVRFTHSHMRRYHLQSMNPGYCITSFRIAFDQDYQCKDDEVNFGIGWVDPARLPTDSISMDCFRQDASFTGWYFPGPRRAGGIIDCNKQQIAGRDVFGNNRKYRMEFDDIRADYVAVFGGIGKWHLTNVTWEECSHRGDIQ